MGKANLGREDELHTAHYGADRISGRVPGFRRALSGALLVFTLREDSGVHGIPSMTRCNCAKDGMRAEGYFELAAVFSCFRRATVAFGLMRFLRPSALRSAPCLINTMVCS